MWMHANPNHFHDKYHICNILEFSDDVYTSIIRFSELFGKDQRILLPNLLQPGMSETREFAQRNRETRNKIILNSFASLGFVILEEEGQEPKDH
jgi:hypothetical protein